MRRAIDQYTGDKGKAPEAIEDLKEAGYLREIPVDPVNLEKREWEAIQGDDPNSNEGEQGLVDVRSLAEGEDSDGIAYSEY